MVNIFRVQLRIDCEPLPAGDMVTNKSSPTYQARAVAGPVNRGVTFRCPA
jgi:hypothetical protein